MSRPCKSRRVFNPPLMGGLRPFGMESSGNSPAILHLEELESLRLVNYENISHDTAAERMNVSRPTFSRIYNRAIEQITRALVEGREIKIEGGNYVMEKEWFRCTRCFKVIEGLESHDKCSGCKFYGEDELIKIK